MTPTARLAFTAYTTALTALSGLTAEAAVQGFTVDPSIQQKLEIKVQESSDFLKAINIVPVTEMKGETLGMGIGAPLAGRANTAAGNPRQTKDATGLGSKIYECVKINSDTHVNYSKLDTWAKFPDFQPKMRGLVITRQALDRIMIGFNGTHAAVATDLAANPMLQDVAKGWLQHIREDSPERNLTEGDKADVIRVGQYAAVQGVSKLGDYANLDALVMDALQLLPEWARQDTGLVCIVGQNLMHDKFFPLVNVQQAPTEQIAAGQIMSQKKLGGKDVVSAPFFPADAILITRLDNLSVYYQDGARRERVVDEPKLDRVETYTSSNDAYVVEDYDYAVFIENISTDAATWPAA
jgi:P2 family phage major capsid protein